MAASMVSCVTDDALRAWLEEFLAVSSKDLGWKLEKCFEAIKYGSRMVNPTLES